MPRTNDERLTFQGPWGGQNDQVSAKQLSLGNFVEAKNVVNRAGRLSPRPGYVAARSRSFIFTPFTMATAIANFTAFDCVKVRFGGGGSIYWSAGGAIYRVDLGALTEPLLVVPAGGFTQFAIDEDNSRIYAWNGTKIIRYNGLIPGQSQGDLVTSAPAVSGGVGGLAYYNEQIFWTGASAVWRSNVAGLNNGVTQIYSSPNTTVGIAVDGPAGFVYFSSPASGNIRRTSLSGSGVVVLISGIDNPVGLAIDATNGRIYWAGGGFAFPPRGIWRANLDGTGAAMVIGPLTLYPYSVAISPTANRVYFLSYDTKAVETAYTDSTRFITLSQYQIERSIVGTSNEVDDVVVLQLFNESDSRTYFGVWFPTQDDAWLLPQGITPSNGTRPASIVYSSRDTAPVGSGQPFQTGFGRANFDNMGLGLGSHVGGVMMANGHGLYVFNYVAPGIDANFPNGLIYLREHGLMIPTVSGITRDLISPGNLTGRFTYKYSFRSSRLGIQGPPTPASGAIQPSSVGAVNEVQTVTMGATGGTWSLRFRGEPTAFVAYNIATATLQSTLEGLTTIGAGNVTVTGTAGVSYVISFKGSLGAADLPMISLGTALLTGGTATIAETTKGWPGQKVEHTITINTTHPSFDNTLPGGRLMDRMLIWRRRELATGGGSYDDTWYLVDDVAIPANGIVVYVDNKFDEERLRVRAPTWGYGPVDSQMVAVHQGRAWVAPMRPGEIRVFNSELADPVTAQPGHEYFAEYSNAVLDDNTPSDHHITLLQSVGDYLLACTNRSGFVINTTNVEYGEIDVRRLMGGVGAASQWAVLRTESVAELGGRLLFPNRLGELFEFNGGDVVPIARAIPGLSNRLTPKTWRKLTANEPGQDTWYFASAVLDPTPGRKLAIFSTFLDTGVASNPAVQLVFHLESGTWTWWDIQGWTWFALREWSGSIGVGRPVICFADTVGNLLRLQSGKADNGTPFNWSLVFPRLHFGDVLLIKLVRNAQFLFDIINYGGADAAVNLGFSVNGGAFDDAAFTPTAADEEIVRPVNVHCRDLQYRLQGAIADNQKHAELVAHASLYQVVGARR